MKTTMNLPIRVTAVIQRDNRVLLIHRFNNGKEYWALPGGSVEQGENAEQAIHREVLEETNLRIIQTQFLFEQLEPNGRLAIFYQCMVAHGEPYFGGPELAQASATNIYQLEWRDIFEFIKMDPARIYPDPTILFKSIDPQKNVEP